MEWIETCQPLTRWHRSHCAPFFRRCRSAWQSWQLLPTLANTGLTWHSWQGTPTCNRAMDSQSCRDQTQACCGSASTPRTCGTSRTQPASGHGDCTRRSGDSRTVIQPRRACGHLEQQERVDEKHIAHQTSLLRVSSAIDTLLPPPLFSSPPRFVSERRVRGTQRTLSA